MKESAEVPQPLSGKLGFKARQFGSETTLSSYPKAKSLSTFQTFLHTPPQRGLEDVDLPNPSNTKQATLTPK